MSAFSLASLAGWALVVLLAAVVRGRRGAIFVGVMMGVYSLVATTLAKHVGPLLPLFAYLHASVYVSFLALARPRMRPLVYHLLVSWPAAWFLASTLLAFPWGIASGLGFTPRGFFVPYAVALMGLVDVFRPRKETVHVVVGAPGPAALARSPRPVGGDSRPLRVVQITDPHLGPFMSVARLQGVCERAVAAHPDLVLLTGDFLTLESQGGPPLLGLALAPLRRLGGKCFACFGNHDHEAPAHVRDALASAGVTLLVDAMTRVDTPAGPVEIVGFDFRRRERTAHLADVVARHPRGVDHPLCIGLLHDPGAFAHLPEGAADLVLSGHTHGGQLGLLWMGLPHTIVSALTHIPDHGLWGRGKDRLYVHRGTGHYGFPLRLGVPPEESVLELHRCAAVARSEDIATRRGPRVDRR